MDTSTLVIPADLKPRFDAVRAKLRLTVAEFLDLLVEMAEDRVSEQVESPADRARTVLGIGR